MNTAQILQHTDRLAEAANTAKNLADHLAGQLRSALKTAPNADEQLHQLHAINEALLAKVADLEFQMEVHRTAETALKKDLQDTKITLFHTQHRENNLRAENTRLKESLIHSKKWERYHGEARDKAVNEMRKAQIALDNARDSLAIERKHADNDFRQMIELKKELERTREELATVREQSKIALDNAQTDLQIVYKARDKYYAEAYEYKAKATKADAQLEIVRKERDEAKAEIERLKAENNRLTHAVLDAQTTATNLMISREAAETSVKDLLATQDVLLKKLEETEKKAVNAAQQAFDNGRIANHYKDRLDRLRDDMRHIHAEAYAYKSSQPRHLASWVCNAATASLNRSEQDYTQT